MATSATGPVVSLMLAVPDARAAAVWYARALGAAELLELRVGRRARARRGALLPGRAGEQRVGQPRGAGHDDRARGGLRRRSRRLRRAGRRRRRRRAPRPRAGRRRAVGDPPPGRLRRSVRPPLARRRPVPPAPGAGLSAPAARSDGVALADNRHRRVQPSGTIPASRRAPTASAARMTAHSSQSGSSVWGTRSGAAAALRRAWGSRPGRRRPPGWGRRDGARRGGCARRRSTARRPPRARLGARKPTPPPSAASSPGPTRFGR